MRELFAAKAIDCVFDVGALNGRFGSFLREKLVFKGTDMPDWKVPLAEYQKVGFGLCGFFPVSRDVQLRAVEFDAVMVRND